MVTKGHTYVRKTPTKNCRFKYVCSFITISIKWLKNTAEWVLHWLLLCIHQKKIVKIAVLYNLAKFLEKHLYHSTFSSWFQAFNYGEKGSFIVFLGVHQKWLLQSKPSEDCLLTRKNTSLEITKTVELRNVVLLVTK